MRSPRVDRPAIPAAYGAGDATEFVDWAHVEERLRTARVYWIATANLDGNPRVRPVDGVYVDGAIWVGGSPEARWVQDVAANPRVAVHLDGTHDVVIVDGEAEVLRSVEADQAERLAAASNEKFPEYRMTASVYRRRGGIAIRPRKVIAWTHIARDPTRFTVD